MRLQKVIAKQRSRRTFRVRNRVRETGRLRLSVFRSNQHIYAQIIDDARGLTLVSASTREALDGEKPKAGGTVESAALVGRVVAQRALEQGVQEVAFDRGRYRYHGRVRALADAAREAGLQF